MRWAALRHEQTLAGRLTANLQMTSDLILASGGYGRRQRLSVREIQACDQPCGTSDITFTKNEAAMFSGAAAV